MEEAILKYIEDNKEKYIELLKEFVQVDSYNPPGNEKNLALKIEEILKKEGIKCEIFNIEGNRANLIAFLNEKFNGKILLYNGHLDVVPPGTESEWKYPPLSGMIKRKKFLYGRGATDMKGGLAAMIITLIIFKQLKIDINGNILLNAVSDEETGGTLGTLWSMENILKKRNIKCDFTVIGEPTGLSPLPKAIIVGEKGHLQVRIITNGVSCHASVPIMGKNAILMMSEIIQNLDKLKKYIPKTEPPFSLEQLKQLVAEAFPNREIFDKIYDEQALLRHLIGSLTQFTYAFTMIKGGIKENVVPDRCEGIIDFRLIPGQKSEIILEGLKKLIENELGYTVREKDVAVGKAEDIFVSLSIYHQSEPSVWKDWDKNNDIKTFYNIVEDIYNKKPFYFLYPACADAHFLRNSGFCEKTILFGPGNASTAHSVDENIEIQDYINAIKVYTLFAYRFFKK
ncbi:MAG: M20 family metallopeptidase [Promethearchaeota archaeon]